MKNAPKYNLLHMGEKAASKVRFSAWSNDMWYMIPFTLVTHMDQRELWNRLSRKLHKHSHYAGMGYSINVCGIHMTSETTGWVELSEYNGIGD